jgi:hypothetical protein
VSKKMAVGPVVGVGWDPGPPSSRLAVDGTDQSAPQSGPSVCSSSSTASIINGTHHKNHVALGNSPGGQLPGAQDSVPILGAAASSVASNPISPSPVSAVSTKKSYATPGQTDGVLVSDSRAHGHRPPCGIADIVALGTSPGGQLPGAQDSVPILGAAVSSAASHPISPYPVAEVLSFQGQTDGVLVSDSRAHGHRPPCGTANTMALGTSPGGQIPGAQDSVPILGAAVSSAAIYPISPYPVAEVLSFQGQTDGVLVSDSRAHGHQPPYGIANIMALGTLPGGQIPGAQDSVPILGAAVSSAAIYPISPSPVSAVSTKLSYAIPGQTDGVLVTDSRAHGHRPRHRQHHGPLRPLPRPCGAFRERHQGRSARPGRGRARTHQLLQSIQWARCCQRCRLRLAQRRLEPFVCVFVFELFDKFPPWGARKKVVKSSD